MSNRKTEWKLVKEAKASGMIVMMTDVFEEGRSEKNEGLNRYFRSMVPGYVGDFSQDTGDDVLLYINDYLNEKGIKVKPLETPYSDGSVVRLIPITQNLDLKVLIEEEYCGGDDHLHSVTINSFIMNDRTERADVDVLVKFVESVLIQFDNNPFDESL